MYIYLDAHWETLLRQMWYVRFKNASKHTNLCVRENPEPTLNNLWETLRPFQ